MALKASFFKKTFHFRFDARTSRGTIKERHSWFIKVWDESNAACFGIGECGPLPGLSAEINTEEEVQKVVDKINGGQLQLPVASDLKMLSQFFDKNFLFIEENSALIFA
ncbi:MAG: hypothetical protein JJE09_09970, partial [Bacteroidia bacterium]|nr:hypothetical protein [Bacteroidia bacterium]